MMACKAIAANAGVPANATLIGDPGATHPGIRPACGSASSCALALLLLLACSFLHLHADALSLQRTQVFDEHLAQQVIHLVLHANCGETLDPALERLALAIERGHGHFGVPLDLVVDRRHRQAALFIDRALLA